MTRFSIFPILLALLASCTGEVGSPLTSGADPTGSAVSPSFQEHEFMHAISFPGLPQIDDPKSFSDSVQVNGVWNNDKADYGVILSPDFTLATKNGPCEVYASNVTEGLHSYGFLTMPKEGRLKVDISLKSNVRSYEVFSVKKTFQASAPVFAKKVVLEVNEKGSYTVVCNGDYSKAFTLFVEDTPAYVTEKNPRVLEAGDHLEPLLVKENEALVFQKGIHRVSHITLSSHSEVHFEPGAYLEAVDPRDINETPVREDWAGCMVYRPFFEASGATDIRISGNGIVDLSKLPWHARNGLKFESCTKVTLEDFTFNNAPEWTCFLACCSQVRLNNLKLFGYRQNSDGYAIVDCQDVQVKGCFGRSGDDLFEVKSMYGNETLEIRDIAFEDFVAWPDKCRGMGIISEVSRDIQRCIWRNAVVVKYPSSWMDKLGAICVISDGKGSIRDVSFENIEVHNAEFHPINVTVAEQASSSISAVRFHNITCSNAQKVRLDNASLNGGSISDLTFASVSIAGKPFMADSPWMYATGEIGVCHFS